MAKFFRCWVIVDGTQPTAFRARDADQLLPTLRQLQRTQPGVSLMWFERGRLWPSPEDARLALIERRKAPPSGRGRAWRPGGEHRDPKARPEISRDEKRARFKKRLITSKSQGGRPPAPRNEGGPPPARHRSTAARPAKPSGGRASSGPPPTRSSTKPQTPRRSTPDRGEQRRPTPRRTGGRPPHRRKP